MEYLRETKLDQLIVSLKQPVLGICLGLQLMCKHSEEGNTDCLGIFDEEVKRFIPAPGEENIHKVPHMGWNRVRQATNSWEEPPLLIMKDLDTTYANAFDGYYAWVQPGSAGWAAGGGNWGGDYLNDFYARMKSKYPDKIAVGAAWPGSNDKQASWSRNRYIDTRCGRTFEDSLRVFRRYYDEQHPLPFLLVETWNDYEEGTAIERGLNTCSGGANNGQKSAAMAASVVGAEK